MGVLFSGLRIVANQDDHGPDAGFSHFEQDPVKRVFLRRTLRALIDFVEEAEADRLCDLASAPSHYAVLLEMLEQPEILARLVQDDPLAPARLRGLKAKRALLEAEGGTLTADQVADVLGITRQGVDKRRRSMKLLGIELGRRGYAYPCWQFNAVGTVPGLEVVLSALHAHDPWSQLIFFLSQNPRLDDMTPLHVLRDGRLDDVLRAVKAYGEHGAA